MEDDKNLDSIYERMKAAYEAESGTELEDVSECGLRLKLAAGEIYALLHSLEWLEKQCFFETASGSKLDLHAEENGLERRAAQKSHGKLTLWRATPLSYDIGIPKGTLCAVSGDSGLRFLTDEEAVLPAGQRGVEVAASSADGGAQMNVPVGVIDTMLSTPTGIEYVTNSAEFSGGADSEGDESLRERIALKMARPATGSNAEFYRRAAAEVEGVSSAGVEPRINGAGTVGVFLWGNGAAPGEEVLAAVAGKLEQLREINVDVSVEAATAKAASFILTVTAAAGCAEGEAKAKAEEIIAKHFARKKVGDHFYFFELSSEMIAQREIENVSFSNSAEINGDQQKIPVQGNIRVVERSAS